MANFNRKLWENLEGIYRKFSTEIGEGISGKKYTKKLLLNFLMNVLKKFMLNPRETPSGIPGDIIAGINEEIC